MKSGFQILFISAELKAIQGPKSRNFLLLFLIVFLSLTALGFGRAMLHYLKQKMDSPFVQFVDVNLPVGSPSNLLEQLSKLELQSRFQYNPPYPVYTSFTNIVTYNGNSESAYTRKVAADDKLFEFIIDSDELLQYSNGDLSNFHDNYGCIVTNDFLKRKLGFTVETPTHLSLLVSISDGVDIYIPIEIKAIVKALPDNVDLLMSEQLFNPLKSKEDFEKLLYDPEIKYVLTGKNVDISALQSMYPTIDVKVLKQLNTHVGISINELLDSSMISSINSHKSVDSVFRVYSFGALKLNSLENHAVDYITFPFTKMDSISSFEVYVKNYDLKIDMSVIKAKENFRIFNNVGNILSLSVMLLSILLIAIFSSNIIIAHIDKNKKSLGTLKAFGLSNGQIIRMYTTITSLFIGAVFLSAFVLAELIAPSVLNFIVERILQMNIGSSNTRYFIGVGIPLGSLLFLAIPMALVSFNVYQHIKGQTPGDLIYGRS